MNLDACRAAISAEPAEEKHKLQFGRILLGPFWAYGYQPSARLDELADEAAAMLSEIPTLEAEVLHVRALRVHSRKRVEAEELLDGQLLKRPGLTTSDRVDLLMEHGHMLAQYRHFHEAIAKYQLAHDSLPKGAPRRDSATQCAAMTMALASGCQVPTSGGGVDPAARAATAANPQCTQALELFDSVPQEVLEPSSWLMRGHLLLLLTQDDAQALDAAHRAVEGWGEHRGDGGAPLSWWERIYVWSRNAHNKYESDFADGHLETARRARMRMREKTGEADEVAAWAQALPRLLESVSVSDEEDGEDDDEDSDDADDDADAPDAAADNDDNDDEGDADDADDAPAWAAHGSAFRLYGRGRSKCGEIDATPGRASEEEVAAAFAKYARGRQPVIIKGAARGWPASTASEWRGDVLKSLAGDELVSVSFTDAKGHMNRFEPFKRWNLTDPRWDVHPTVLVRPTAASMRLRDFLTLLDAEERGARVLGGVAYVSQLEMHLHLPALLPLLDEPGWVAPTAKLKETNLWLSRGATVTSLHQDTTDNLMVMIEGAKDFLLFPPEQKENLYYETITELTLRGGAAAAEAAADAGLPSDRNETPTERSARIAKLEAAAIGANHGLVDVTAPDLAAHPKYKDARGLVCRVSAGDALYVPLGWHHAVHSLPARRRGGRNLGINLWYHGERWAGGSSSAAAGNLGGESVTYAAKMALPRRN